MGADLYIKQIHDPIRRRYQPFFDEAVRLRDHVQQRLRVTPKESPDRPALHQLEEAAQDIVTHFYDAMYAEGYFRDSYNATNVLCRLGLSWWQDVKPLLENQRELKGEALRAFRERVIQATLQLPTKEEVRKQGGVVDNDENSLAVWHNHFRDQHAALIVFLNRAVELDTAIWCSL